MRREYRDQDRGSPIHGILANISFFPIVIFVVRSKSSSALDFFQVDSSMESRRRLASKVEELRCAVGGIGFREAGGYWGGE